MQNTWIHFIYQGDVVHGIGNRKLAISKGFPLHKMRLPTTSFTLPVLVSL